MKRQNQPCSAASFGAALLLLSPTVFVVAQPAGDSRQAAPGEEVGGTGPTDEPEANAPEVAAPDASGSDAAATDTAPADSNDPAWWQRERVTGDWTGARSWLEERGITFDMTFTTYYQHVAHGGLKTRNAHTIIGVNDFELTLDLDAMKLVPGGSIYVWGSNAWGESPSTRGWTGDLFWVNGAEVGDRPIDAHEVVYEQSLAEGKWIFRVGKVCLSCYFDTNEYAYDTTQTFLNYGLNNAPNIPFPASAFTAIGAQVIYTPCDWFYAQAGVADADAEFNETGFRTAFHGPAHTFSIYEVGLTPTFHTSRGELPGHYRWGFWYDPQPKERFYNDLGGLRRTAPQKKGDYGYYVNFDQAVLRENPADATDEQGLGVFLRYSYAGGDVNLVEHFWSAGFQYQGLIPTRDEDVWGVGAAQGILSGDARYTGASPHRETVLETYYRVQVFPWLTVSPDFQWILRPGGFDGPDVLVAGLRVRMTL
ncbi:MAG: carbohydrate porin [Planctomycetes bacterium]|nr:carbohydrate porin [Planctomycetota bacterium]